VAFEPEDDEAPSDDLDELSDDGLESPEDLLSDEPSDDGFGLVETPLPRESVA
jgi:hypothetical protein